MNNFRSTSRGFLRLGWSLILLSLGGCASVSVQPQSAAAPPTAQRPLRFVIESFTFPAPAMVRANRQGDELIAFERKLQVRLRDRVVRELRGLGLEAVAASPERKSASVTSRKGRLSGMPREAAWLVTGQFTRVNQGSRGLRLVIGLGAGGTKMDTAVQVLDFSSGGMPVLTFRTTGGSNAEPGLIGAGGPVTGPVGITITAVNVVSTVASSGGHGITEDSDRTARMIAAYLSADLARRGYLDPAKVKHFKPLGPTRTNNAAEIQ